MLIDIEYMVVKQLNEKLEDLYTEALGDECPLVVDYVGMEDSTAIIVFKDYEFPKYKYVLAESLNLDRPKIEMQLQSTDYGNQDTMKLYKMKRKHERILTAIKEFWEIEFEVID